MMIDSHGETTPTVRIFPYSQRIPFSSPVQRHVAFGAGSAGCGEGCLAAGRPDGTSDSIRAEQLADHTKADPLQCLLEPWRRSMSFFSLRVAPRRSRRRAPLSLEILEDRSLPSSGMAISGYVFNDLNGNGLRDPGEPALANSAIVLQNAAGAVIGSTTTDANGFYRFDADASISQAPQTQSFTLNFPDRPTNSSILQHLPQFNPALGRLIGIDFQINGRITSQIRAENLDDEAAAIAGTVVGNILVTAHGLQVTAQTAANNQTFQAAAFDGVIDFAGASGVTFAVRTVTGSASASIANEADLNAYTGTGNMTISVMPRAQSSATGGGNLQAAISSSGGAQITITYRYIPNNSLRPGNYVVRQTGLPSGYLNGLLSRNGVVLPNSYDNRSIAVQLLNADAPNNNFGHIVAAQLGGTVYIDVPNGGVLFPGAVGVAGVNVALQGTNDRGQSVSLQTVTGPDGRYLFNNLRPGTYHISQGAAAGLLPGKINPVGTLGGAAQANRFSSIVVSPGALGADYNFAWLKPASVTGFVYADLNRNGLFDQGDRGVVSTWVLLTGTDDRGQAVRLVAWTSATGAYTFNNLRPGLYTLTHTAIPPGWRRSAVNIGSLGGIQSTDSTSSVPLGVGDFGRDYNFGIFSQAAGVGKGNFLGSYWRM
jgi:protocatechuate 3,4-dioxygenase beta subunit